MDSIVKIKKLSFSYDDNEFISNLSLDIERNSYTCIIGPNGSGKTTLSRLICGLLEFKDG